MLISYCFAIYFEMNFYYKIYINESREKQYFIVSIIFFVNYIRTNIYILVNKVKERFIITTL